MHGLHRNLSFKLLMSILALFFCSAMYFLLFCKGAFAYNLEAICTFGTDTGDSHSKKIQLQGTGELNMLPLS